MTAPRNVLLLCWRDTHHPQGGGSETYLERVGAELVRAGVSVTYVTAAYSGAKREEMRQGIRFVRAGGRISVYPRVLGMLVAARYGRGRLADTRPDAIVDTQNGVPFFASLVSRAPTVVLVHHCHREQWPVAGKLLGRLGWFLESRVSPRVHRRNRYVTVSSPSRDELVDLGVSADRITVIHNGIDPIPDKAVEASTERSAQVRLCVLSRLVPHKQVEHALAVVAELRRSASEVHLDVIGDGWWHDELSAAAADLGVSEHVTFHGHVSESDKHQILSHADIHLMPSRKEGWGLAVVEAAQHRVPTVGYRHATGLTESIDDGRTGILVEGIDEFVSATRKLVESADDRIRLGTAAQSKAQRYSWELTGEQMLTVLTEVSAPDEVDLAAAR